MPFHSLRPMTSFVVPNEELFSRVEEFLAAGKEVVIGTKGDSMLPFIRGGRDSVVLRKCTAPSIGDIVLARVGGRYIMHRIISLGPDRCTMMGDGNLSGTESFGYSDLIGKVIWIVRPGGKRVRPGKARLWKALLPLRRYLLAMYRIMLYRRKI